MRIESLRISGFRPIPFCASISEDLGEDVLNITWEEPFEIKIATNGKMINAIMGANSSGKSSIFGALEAFNSSASKLPESLFNSKVTTSPIIVELTIVGVVTDATDWQKESCFQGQPVDEPYKLTISKIWTTEKRYIYIKQPDNSYKKVSVTRYNQECVPLLPQFRLVASDSRFNHEADPSKSKLIHDLLEAQLNNEEEGSIVKQVRDAVTSLNSLVTRERMRAETQPQWAAIEELEDAISSGLSSVSPRLQKVRFQLTNNIPNIEDIFYKGQIMIDDGVELDFQDHGLGMQRALVVSILQAWCQFIRSSDKDYIFAIEEPEIYLHPHATRMLISTLEEISDDNQVIFTTHSNEFINRVPHDNIITIRRIDEADKVISKAVYPDLSTLPEVDKTKVQRYLLEDNSDMLFARAVLLVEGQAELFAFPNFADKLELELDKNGISIVCTNGFTNLEIYHYLLTAFEIPHAAFIDGDGQKERRESQYTPYCDSIFVLDEDFEYLLASHLSDARLLEIVNGCRRHLGKDPKTSLEVNPVTAENLKSAWWKRLKDKLKGTIPSEHRNNYEGAFDDLKEQLFVLATEVVDNKHISVDDQTKRYADQLVKCGKPLVGRVAGELLTKEEIENMAIVEDALREVLSLAQSTSDE